MRTVKYYTPADGHLAEEFNRDTGVAQGAADLTWSYASVLTAAFARAEERGARRRMWAVWLIWGLRITRGFFSLIAWSGHESMR